ncbi:hypothetical protein EIP91_004116 [Steccherinum ochraceum]|uniref:Uncharacterized protein n=1 Tax=Steccherinum ochraceum TaxID=92696 RepID=A0A4R0R9B7_9APHY|nr:hypothetical protein EIP91_004116 [Steccherinum ochraceum]
MRDPSPPRSSAKLSRSMLPLGFPRRLLHFLRKVTLNLSALLLVPQARWQYISAWLYEGVDQELLLAAIANKPLRSWLVEQYLLAVCPPTNMFHATIFSWRSYINNAVLVYGAYLYYCRTRELVAILLTSDLDLKRLRRAKQQVARAIFSDLPSSVRAPDDLFKFSFSRPRELVLSLSAVERMLRAPLFQSLHPALMERLMLGDDILKVDGYRIRFVVDVVLPSRRALEVKLFPWFVRFRNLSANTWLFNNYFDPRSVWNVDMVHAGGWKAIKPEILSKAMERRAVKVLIVTPGPNLPYFKSRRLSVFMRVAVRGVEYTTKLLKTYVFRSATAYRPSYAQNTLLNLLHVDAPFRRLHPTSSHVTAFLAQEFRPLKVAFIEDVSALYADVTLDPRRKGLQEKMYRMDGEDEEGERAGFGFEIAHLGMEALALRCGLLTRWEVVLVPKAS